MSLKVTLSERCTIETSPRGVPFHALAVVFETVHNPVRDFHVLVTRPMWPWEMVHSALEGDLMETPKSWLIVKRQTWITHILQYRISMRLPFEIGQGNGSDATFLPSSEGCCSTWKHFIGLSTLTTHVISPVPLTTEINLMLSAYSALHDRDCSHSSRKWSTLGTTGTSVWSCWSWTSSLRLSPKFVPETVRQLSRGIKEWQC